MRSEMKRHVIIIGAGIIGASIAYHLSLHGARVTVIDADGPASGASGASDGAVSTMTKSPGQLMELALRSKAYYAELGQPGGLLHSAYHERPAYLVASNEAEVGILEKQAEGLRRINVDLRMLEGDSLRETIPALQKDTPLVMEAKGEGHTLGYQVVDRFLKASGADIRRMSPVTGLRLSSDGGRCVGVSTREEVIAADDVVVAAGMGCADLIVGLDIHPQRGQLIVTDRSDKALNLPGPLYFASYLAVKADLTCGGPARDSGKDSSALVIDPLRTGQFLIGSTRESGADPSHTEFSAVQRNLGRAIEFVPRLADLDVIRVFAGIRVKTSDGVPIAGPVSATAGLWVATGFASDGICLAPLIGRELCLQMMDRETLPEFSHFSPSRFNLSQAV